MLEIHKDAISNFNTKGAELLYLIEEIPSKRNDNDGFLSEMHVKGHITEKDIIDFHQCIITNGFGEEIGFSFFHEKKEYGIINKNYKNIQKLAEAISKQKSFIDKVSQQTIKNLIFQWIKNKCINSDPQDLTTFIIAEATGKVAKQEIWIPIKFLQVEINFKIGHIEFKPISKKMIDTLVVQFAEEHSDEEVDIKELFENNIRKFQGYAAATLLIEAEPNRAQEIILEETRKALLFLRIFNPASIHPRVTSSYEIWGSEKTERVNVLFLQEERFCSLNDQSLKPVYGLERLDKTAIATAMKSGLKILSDLLINDNPTPFQKVIMDSLYIFARCATSKDPADKMVYILVALESLFLRNNTEPIQQNLAERMAFLIENTIEARRKLIRDVKNAYGIRSSFVHHGATIDDFEVLEKFMWHAWHAITAVIFASPSFKSKEDFLDQIDNKKFA